MEALGEEAGWKREDEEPFGGGLCERGEDIGAQNLVGSIALGIFDGTAITGGEEQHTAVAQQLHHVIIEIARFFLIGQDDEEGLCLTGCGEHHSGC